MKDDETLLLVLQLITICSVVEFTSWIGGARERRRSADRLSHSDPGILASQIFEKLISNDFMCFEGGLDGEVEGVCWNISAKAFGRVLGLI
jgi:hypothetical protein